MISFVTASGWVRCSESTGAAKPGYRERQRRMKKLYTVTIEAEIVVLADSEEEAAEEAQDAMSELSSYDYDIHAMPMRYLPGGWDRKTLPFGTEDDKTIQEWLDAGAGETFLKEQEEFKRRVERARAKGTHGSVSPDSGSGATPSEGTDHG